MNHRRLRRSALAVAAALTSAMLITGCSSEEEPKPATSTQTAEPSEETSAAPAGEQTEVKIGETIKDADMGDTIEVISAVRDFPSEEKPEVAEDGGEIVLLQVKISPGTEYGGRLSAGGFQISWDDGEDFWSDKTRMVEDEMNAADFKPLEDISRRDGGEHTGWIAFFADERADSYLMEYTRRGAKVIGQDKEIEEFTQTVEIPAP